MVPSFQGTVTHPYYNANWPCLLLTLVGNVHSANRVSKALAWGLCSVDECYNVGSTSYTVCSDWVNSERLDTFHCTNCFCSWCTSFSFLPYFHDVVFLWAFHHCFTQIPLYSHPYMYIWIILGRISLVVFLVLYMYCIIDLCCRAIACSTCF